MAETETSQTKASQDIFGFLAVWLGVAALVLSPTQWSLELPGSIHVAPADPLILLAFGCLVLTALRTQHWKLLKPPPTLLIIFLVLTLLSIAVAENRLSALKEFIQYTEYFAVGFVVFRGTITLGLPRRQFVNIFVAISSAVVLLGVIQYFAPDIAGFAVGATFGNRNVYGGFLTLALPVICSLTLSQTYRLPARLGLWGVLAAGIVSLLSGGALLGLLAGLGLVSLLKGPRTFAAFTIIVAGLLIWVAPGLPRDNPDVWFESLAVYERDGAPAQRYPEWQAAARMAADNPLLGAGAGNYQKNIGKYYGIVPNRPEASEPDSQNLYLVLASSLGFPALVIFSGSLAWFITAGIRGAQESEDVRVAAAGAAGALTAFAVAAVWAPLVVRGIGLPLVAVMVMAADAHLPGRQDTEPGADLR